MRAGSYYEYKTRSGHKHGATLLEKRGPICVFSDGKRKWTIDEKLFATCYEQAAKKIEPTTQQRVAILEAALVALQERMDAYDHTIALRPRSMSESSLSLSRYNLTPAHDT